MKCLRRVPENSPFQGLFRWVCRWRCITAFHPVPIQGPRCSLSGSYPLRSEVSEVVLKHALGGRAPRKSSRSLAKCPPVGLGPLLIPPPFSAFGKTNSMLLPTYYQVLGVLFVRLSRVRDFKVTTVVGTGSYSSFNGSNRVCLGVKQVSEEGLTR